MTYVVMYSCGDSSDDSLTYAEAMLPIRPQPIPPTPIADAISLDYDNNMVNVIGDKGAIPVENA